MRPTRPGTHSCRSRAISRTSTSTWSSALLPSHCLTSPFIRCSHHPREGDIGPLTGRINAAYRTIQDAKTRLVAAAVAPPPANPRTMTLSRQLDPTDRRPSVPEGGVQHLRQQRSLSLSSGSLPPSTSSPTARFHQQHASTSISTSGHSRNSSSGSDQARSVDTDATEVETDAPPAWASWPQRKENIAEYAAAQMNLQEIENDLRDVEQRIEVTHGAFSEKHCVGIIPY